MTRRRLLLSAACAGFISAALGVPARAADGTIALLPAPVLRGASANGRVVTDALRSSLRGKGFRLTADSEVQGAMSGIDPRKPIPIATLAQIRERLGVDYVVYPRVLSVGSPLTNGETFQATVLVNVIGKSAKSFVHTRQIGQEFRLRRGATADNAVIPGREAATQAGKLLEGFYAKVR